MFNVNGLRLPDPKSLEGRPRLAVPPRFQPPITVGNWEYLMAPENQGSHPWCAAFSGCSYLQGLHWITFGYPVQFDEERLYRAAKAIDGDANDGTALESIIAAAQQANYSTRTDLPPPVIKAHLTTKATDLPWIVHQHYFAIIGMQIDEGWMSPRSPDMLITPKGSVLGGHAVLVDWYNLEKERIGGPNWWADSGSRWSMSMSDFAKQFVYGYGLRIEWPGVPLPD